MVVVSADARLSADRVSHFGWRSSRRSGGAELLTVFPHRRIKGYISAGTTPLQAPAGEALPLSEAMSTTWPTDAHFVCYVAEDHGAGHRLRLSTLGDEDGSRPTLAYLAVDVDFPSHSHGWDDLALAADAAGWIETAVGLYPEVGFYSTLGGFRLLAELERPLPAELAESALKRWHTSLIEAGVPVDTACSDWTRMYRLPNVVREGVGPVTPPHELFHLPTGPIKLDLAGLVSRVKPVSAEVTGFGERPVIPIPMGEEPIPQGERRTWTLEAAGRFAALNETADPLEIYRHVAPRKAASVYPGESLDKILDDTWAVCCYIAASHATQVSQASALDNSLDLVLGSVEKSDKAERDAAFGVDWADLERRFIIALPKASHYVAWDPKIGAYTDFIVTKEHLSVLAERMIQDAPNPRKAAELLDLYRHTDNGPKRLQPIEIFRRYGRYAKSVTYEYGYIGGSFDGTKDGGELVMGCCPVVEAEPEFDPDIDMWLRAIFGEVFDQGCRWLATCDRIQEPSCAIALIGAPGGGKSLFARCVSSLFNAEPVAWDQLMQSRFNGQMLESPIIFADEPKKGLGRSSTEFRRLLSAGGLNVERKGLQVAWLRGCPRFVIAANNTDAISFSDSLSGDDVEALIERIGIVKVSPEARRVLEEEISCKPSEFIGARFAGHVAWLAANLGYEPTGRWLVPGWDTGLIRNLSAHTEIAHEILSIIGKLITMEYMTHGNDGIHLVGEGVEGHELGVYVEPQMLKSLWATHSEGGTVTQKVLSEAIKTNSVGSAPVSVRIKRGPGRPKRLWRLNLTKLASVAIPDGLVSSEAELRQIIITKTTPRNTKTMSELVTNMEP